MNDAAKPLAKRPYSSPVLIIHGTVTALTRAGYGSKMENEGNSKKKRP